MRGGSTRRQALRHIPAGLPSGAMARVVVQDRSLRVCLNPAEKFLALRRNVNIPLVDIMSTRVVDRPLDDIVRLQVTMGFAAAGAPLAKVATIGPRARTEAGRALLIVYLNRPAIVIDVDPTGSGWSLLIVSVRHPMQIERVVRAGIGDRA